MSDELKAQIKKEIQTNPIHIFMKGTPDMPQCGFSAAACDVFRQLNVSFTATDVLPDLSSYRAALSEISNWPTIPQIFINGEFIGGSDIVLELHRSGDLQTTVQEALEATTTS